MPEATVSMSMGGKGSINHNQRKFIAKNVDEERTEENIKYENRKIQEVFRELFQKAVDEYNAKQTRKDRMIDDYYEKILRGHQEKPFSELVVQIGDMNSMGCGTENAVLSKAALDEYMRGFQERNPNLRVFSAVMHNDEATPHLHIDFVPYMTGSKRGLATRVSLKGALNAEGYMGGTSGDTEWNQFVEHEKEVLTEIMKEHGIDRIDKNEHRDHLSVLDFKVEKRLEEVKHLDEEIEKKESRIEDISDSMSSYHETFVETYEKIKKLFREPKPLESAKGYLAEVMPKVLKKISDTIAKSEYKVGELRRQVGELTTENAWLRKGGEDRKKEIDELETQNRTFSHYFSILKKHYGEKTLQRVIDEGIDAERITEIRREAHQDRRTEPRL